MDVLGTLETWFGPTWPAVWALAKIVAIIVPLMLCVAYLTLAERKVIGWMQVRRGPNRVTFFGIRWLGGWAQPIADDLLHRVVQVVIEEAVPEAHQQGLGTVGYETGTAWVVAVEVLDDDRRFDDRAIAVAQRRDLAERRKLHVRRPLGRIAQVHGDRLERRTGLIEGDQDLPAVGRQRMQMQLERHGDFLPRQLSHSLSVRRAFGKPPP